MWSHHWKITCHTLASVYCTNRACLVMHTFHCVRSQVSMFWITIINSLVQVSVHIPFENIMVDNKAQMGGGIEASQTTWSRSGPFSTMKTLHLTGSKANAASRNATKAWLNYTDKYKYPSLATFSRSCIILLAITSPLSCLSFFLN